MTSPGFCSSTVLSSLGPVELGPFCLGPEVRWAAPAQGGAEVDMLWGHPSQDWVLLLVSSGHRSSMPAFLLALMWSLRFSGPCVPGLAQGGMWKGAWVFNLLLSQESSKSQVLFSTESWHWGVRQGGCPSPGCCAPHALGCVSERPCPSAHDTYGKAVDLVPQWSYCWADLGDHSALAEDGGHSGP